MRDPKLDFAVHSAIGKTSEGIQVDRRAPWVSFLAPAVVTNRETGQPLRAQSGEIHEYGCFIQTASPFRQGTRINVQIAHAGVLFAALGRIAYVTSGGMGIVFSRIENDSLEILAKWIGMPRPASQAQAKPETLATDTTLARPKNQRFSAAVEGDGEDDEGNITIT